MPRDLVSIETFRFPLFQHDRARMRWAAAVKLRDLWLEGHMTDDDVNRALLKGHRMRKVDMKRALMKGRGNVTRAADLLGMKSGDLRRAIAGDPELRETMTEALTSLVERAEAEIIDALDAKIVQDRLRAAVFFLSRHRIALKRGWANKSMLKIAFTPEK